MAKAAPAGSASRSAGFYIFIALFVLLAALPILWIFKMSMVTNGEITASTPTILPQTPTLEHYRTIFNDPGFMRSILNSVVVAGTTTIICLSLGSIAAYAIARLRFRFKSAFLTLILALAFFPPVAIIGPLFVIFSGTDIVNTYAAMIIPDTVFALPLTVWLLVAFFKELPFDLEDAAKVDGATTLQAFWRVIVPLSAPGVFTTAILTFIFAWNEFLFATTFAFDSSTQPVTVVIPSFAGIFTINYGAQAAAAIVVTVPLAILVLFFQRRIVSGLTSGAVKG
ncbi:MAG: carbohydrate ABC transporter permease [Actinomycetota bacterium]|nr:carbohydrate ABC transporter permease [Actinomycetota bacterium]